MLSCNACAFHILDISFTKFMIQGRLAAPELFRLHFNSCQAFTKLQGCYLVLILPLFVLDYFTRSTVD